MSGAPTRTRFARLYGPRDLRLEVADVPAPGDGEVLLKMAAGGICGSDLHYYQDGGFGPVRVREPIIPGHEASGRVAVLGAGVSGLAIDDLVAVNPSQPCGTCRFCGEGLLSTALTCASWAVQCVSPTHRVCSAIGWWFRPSNVIPQARR